MQHRDELERKIVKKLEKYIGHPHQQEALVLQLANNWDMPIGHASDLVSMNVGLVAESDFVVYVIASILEIKNLDDYYSKQEIKGYSKSKFHVDKLQFPFKLDMIQVSSDQWIGSIMISDLMKLRDAQIITYNENTQRTIERVVRDGKEFYRITVDNQVVAAIAEEFEEEQYIPNTLTFNLPEDALFSYDKGNKQLVIKEMKSLDIIDGYHRYLGATKALIKNPELDFPMELRIVFFSENKARHFIWQEDQKTKMTKLDSQSFNQYDYGNKIVEFLNINPLFIGCGLIGKRGIIDAGYMSQIIDILSFHGLKEKEAKEVFLTLRKNLITTLNDILEENPALLGNKWDYNRTLAVLYVAINWKKSDGTKSELCNKFYERLSDNEYKNIRFQDNMSSKKKLTLAAIYNKCKEER